MSGTRHIVSIGWCSLLLDEGVAPQPLVELLRKTRLCTFWSEKYYRGSMAAEVTIEGRNQQVHIHEIDAGKLDIVDYGSGDQPPSTGH